ncbi:hypothetical protein BGZ70_003190 [Mortierella alpina]|uniref:Uncharacterized protein n=1 Tax=Mortierella alpina TaxID=64518 RepID=A0A9P6LVF6_MORAP|nr:hypothetical protein BGZ70_003190 [Mortierella alpina]
MVANKPFESKGSTQAGPREDHNFDSQVNDASTADMRPGSKLEMCSGVVVIRGLRS